MKSVMTHNFAQVPKADIPRSSFDRSHGYKTTFDAGWLIPVFVDEALPGDTFNLKMNAFARLATPIKPIMDNMFLDSFFFAVPIRLIWDNWQKFNGEQRNPADSTSYVLPTMTAPVGGYTTGSLHDYFGIPISKAGLVHHSLFHRAYNLIWNEWFRDQNLQNSVVVDVDDGPDTPGDYVLLRRGKRHDYFTSALPWPQKGPAVSIPLGTSADVRTGAAAGQDLAVSDSSGTDVYKMGAGDVYLQMTSTAGTTGNKLYADLTNATAATINSLRQAFQIQKMYERDARGGTRYTEIVRSHFGVVSPDARLQRPEYLGGGSTTINFHPVPATVYNGTGGPQGNLAAFATGMTSGHGFVKSFTEHCVLIGMVVARADLTYQQGLNRMFSRSTRFDFYWPALSSIGEQAILQKEIWADGTANDNIVFGYQERYAEYRYKPSLVTGYFRSDSSMPLDIWHLSQDFATAPVLNASFIQEDPPVDRIIATPLEPHFLFDSYFQLKCARPMPVYSVPGMIDHF